MAEVDEWSLSDKEVEVLDSLVFDAYSQSPTYYSSDGCDGSFAAVDHPEDSACGAGVLPKDASGWC